MYFFIKNPGYSSDLLHFAVERMNTHEFSLILLCYFLATLVVLVYLKNCFRELSFRNCDVLSSELLSCCPIVLCQWCWLLLAKCEEILKCYLRQLF